MSEGFLDELEAIAAAERAIWSQDYAALRDLGPLDRATWAGSVQGDLVVNGIDPELLRPEAAGPASPAVAVVMLLKDEADIVGHNLAWLYYCGVRRFVLCNNASADGTQAEIDRFCSRNADVEVMTILDPILRYTQAQKTSAMMHFATTTWPDVRWVFPIDADEFLVAFRGLQGLADIPDDVQAITIPKVIHFRHRLGGEGHADTPLAKMALRSKIFIVPPKVACRASLDLTITQGNHGILTRDGKAVRYVGGFALGLYHREFQTRSFEHFLTKVRNGGIAIKAAERHLGYSVGGAHWLEWYRVLEEEGDDGLRRVYEAECVRDINPHFVVDPFYACSE